MARKKRVEQVEEQPTAPVLPSEQEGDVDPYASGVSLPNPEPNNGNPDGPVIIESGQEGESILPSLDDVDQDEIAENREEQIATE